MTRAQAAADWLREAPRVTGRLDVAPGRLDAFARDQGNTARVRPRAILRPADAEDVAKLVRHCRRLGVSAAPRGAGHTSFGQSLVDGLVIDMRSLDTLFEVDSRHVDVQAGALWQAVVNGGQRHGVRVRNGVPAVLRLTVGGVLSIGGISTARIGGAVIDAVEELEVVTGRGDLVTCSERENRALFEAVLGGLGQFGIITRARLGMVPVAPLARGYALSYDRAGLGEALSDQRILADREGIDELLIRCQWRPDGGTLVELSACAYHDGRARPDDARLMRGLSRAPTRVSDTTYLERAGSIDRRYAEYEANGWTDCVKLWSDNFVADHGSGDPPGGGPVLEDLVGAVLDDLTERDWSPTSTALLFRKQRDAFRLPGLRLPAPSRGRHVCLLAIASDAFGKHADATYVRDLMARNRRWFELIRRAGGTLYPLGATALDEDDWRRQYEDRYAVLRDLKREFDPDGVLTPGPGIF